MPRWFVALLIALATRPVVLPVCAEQSVRPMTVEDCIHAAVLNSLGLSRQRLASQQAELDVDLQTAGFWPVLTFAGGYADERSLAAGGSGTEDEGTWSFSTGVAVTAPLGTRLSTAISNARRHTDAQAVLFDPEHRARLEFTLNQPLLRGFGVAVNTADLEQARLGARIVRQALRAAVNGLIRDVEWAYWDLYFAQQDVAIKARSLERAQRQYQDTAENIRRGLLPELDIHVVEESQVSFQRRRADSLNALAAAQTALAGLMQFDAVAARTLVASDEPDPAGLVLPEDELLQRTALKDNPSLEAVRARAAAAHIQLVVERDDRLPRLDLDASLALNGATAAAGDTLEQLFSGDRREAYVGLRLEVPLFELLDDAQVAQARIEVRRQLLLLEETEQSLLLDVEDLRRDIQHGQVSYALACRISELSRKKLEAQQDKYRAGVAALKDLVQFLRELDEAEIEQLRTLVSLHKRVAGLHATLGDLHRVRGIDVR